MEITEIRRANLRSLLDAFLSTGGRKKDFAELIGIEAPQLTHIVSEPPSRNIGDRIARRVEVNLSLNRGWLDVIQNGENFDINHSESNGYTLKRRERLNHTNTFSDQSFTLVKLRENDCNGAIKLDSDTPVLENITFSDEAAKIRFGSRNSDDLRMYHVTGDSMLGTLNPGEIAVLDITCDVFGSDGIYLFTFGDDHPHLKRLQRVKDRIVVISDNAIYERWEILPDEREKLRITGALVGKLDVDYQRLG